MPRGPQLGCEQLHACDTQSSVWNVLPPLDGPTARLAAEWTSVGALSRASSAGIERHLVASRGKMLGREEEEGRVELNSQGGDSHPIYFLSVCGYRDRMCDNLPQKSGRSYTGKPMLNKPGMSEE